MVGATKPSIDRVIFVENEPGEAGIVGGIITRVYDDGGSKEFVDVLVDEDQNVEPRLLFKVPKKHERGERDPTPSWAWFWPSDSPAVEADEVG